MLKDSGEEEVIVELRPPLLAYVLIFHQGLWKKNVPGDISHYKTMMRCVNNQPIWLIQIWAMSRPGRQCRRRCSLPSAGGSTIEGVLIRGRRAA